MASKLNKLIYIGILLCLSTLIACSVTPPTENVTEAISLPKIIMNTENIGWSVVQESLLRTTDGGVHWKVASPTDVKVSEGQYFILDDKQAWIASDHESTVTIHHTRDGGKTWITMGEIKTKGIFPRIFFTDEKSGWMMVSIKRAMNADSVQILQTTDGGGKWRTVAESESTETGNVPVEGNKTGISFRDRSTGWIRSVQLVQELPWLSHTKDGGLSWKKQYLIVPKLEEPAPFTFDSPKFFSEKEGILVFHSECERQQCTYFFQTTNGGDSWVHHTVLKYNNPNFYMNYDFVSIYTGWTTDGENLYHTNDYAMSWKMLVKNREVDKTVADSDRIVSIDFVTDQVGWIVISSQVAPNQLFKTTDGGHTWRIVHPRLVDRH
ncbi:WD40/YVTN/BNR-like repeat-containing protein [Brevibacillus agri]|uniref:WD40/YVTN/BNR-like repeat-containing protein n=1 Tax=Brevibacillus agri TaxID=51101 RepID=UPI003D21B03A